ncbi:MAG: 3-methyl-2-oxobutanoate dehydrogenase subunit VorB [Bacillota bacterium]|jgi:2-oxoglutarate ferredoxin oxidoreductase subunit alpha|nr:3-methyl-2-oxobutanoate dehydrogenase subunit VorB [Bacillota bacterium]NLM07573.1 3-methyl-2-oxobutanoate dehydrogenase subunit VorB [Clostridiales Family XIII bacterium]HOA42450.1 3-methyl-2-oxobutanoate dehydrogenase subunit VorB [Bacillota bacterium]HPZ59060.1 3-methyl-2-oxobutanoate dehydrogenase subunit VorB [Bacillota bacterium]
MSEKVLMKGNEAFAEAAIRSGCRYYFGYPITPQNEITEYMSRELEKVGGSFVQAESEVAAINMAYGAGAAGGKVFISSSSPGIALMQEGFSFICSTEIPLVILNVSRGGPGVGTIQPGQADYYQATRGGGNGDYHLFVYAPSSIQEAVDMMPKAFKIAEEYRNPVMILADGMLGQMMEPVILPEPVPAIKQEDIPKAKPWALTGTNEARPHNVIRSLYLVAEELEARILELDKKYQRARKELVEYEAINLENAEVVFVAYGSTARITEEAIDLLAEAGINAGMIRPISLWPYPYEAFDKIPSSTKAVISVELSRGQMIDDVKIGCCGRFPVSLCSRVGGMLLTPQEIAADAKKVLGVE